MEKIKTIILKCFLEECKYAAKEKKISKFITDNIEISSNEENSDEDGNFLSLVLESSIPKYKKNTKCLFFRLELEI